LIFQNKKKYSFSMGYFEIPQMENLISKQKNNHAGRGRGSQLVALRDMLSSYDKLNIHSGTKV
jgi:hypothetical protein